ncbi:hypothetical protein [Bryobacter aggregatus]|uniref:hypothetical protein n=1 Tax=Bryobacter aggregatus TaxID=360054 RepID=UPI0004E14AF5|nr:hypothetical protein [Bryobacter aggregatus]
MATEKQFRANRDNAQRSTGPSTAAGKAKSAANRVTHGLNSNAETLFAAHSEEAKAYQAHTQILQADCQPDSALEQDAFDRYAWATFQAKRARKLELLTESLWLESPSDPKLFSQMERTQKMAAAHERRAGRALNELRQLQKDRFAAYEVYAEHCIMGKEVPIAKSLPIASLRATNLQRTNPNYLAQFLLYQTKEVQDTAASMLREANPGLI